MKLSGRGGVPTRMMTTERPGVWHFRGERPTIAAVEGAHEGCAMATLIQNESEGVRVLRISGSLNHEGVEPVETPFESATPAGARVVVDLSEVDMMTTPGIAMLIAASKRVEGSAGKFVVTGAKGFVADLLHRCRLDTVLTLVPSAGEATDVARA